MRDDTLCTRSSSGLISCADGRPHPSWPPGDGGGPAAPVLCMLGYGNLGALANDPRVNPRAWQDGNDVGATHEQLQPNCGVSLRVTVSFFRRQGLAWMVSYALLVHCRPGAPRSAQSKEFGAFYCA